MDNEVAIVEQNPTTVVGALSAKGPVAEFTEMELDVISETSHVSIGGSGSDHEDIRYDHKI